jgi:hypothetical protein
VWGLRLVGLAKLGQPFHQSGNFILLLKNGKTQLGLP